MVVLYAFFGFHLKHLQFSARDEDIVDKKGLTMNGYRGEGGGGHGWDVLFCNTISQNNKKEKEKLKLYQTWIYIPYYMKFSRHFNFATVKKSRN